MANPKNGEAGRQSRMFNVLIERDAEGYYVATVVGLRGCHTQARSLDVLMERVQEAIAVCLDDEDEVGSRDFVGVQQVVVEQ